MENISSENRQFICVGGSWVAPKALVEAKRWDKIEQLATRAKNSFSSEN